MRRIKGRQVEKGVNHLGVLHAFDQRGELVGAYPCALDDVEFETVRQALARLIGPGVHGLLRRILGGLRK